MNPAQSSASALHLPLLIAVLLAGGCMVGPNYKEPKAAMPAVWHSQLASGLNTNSIDSKFLDQWWTVFNDSVLSNLMEQARAGNLDLRQAESNLREARAQRGIAKSALFPTLSLGAGATRTWASEENGKGGAANNFSTGFDAGWELDIFGGKRRSLESATATAQSAQEEMRDVLVSLYAEVALNYVEVRSYQTQLSITKASAESQKDTYDIARWRHEAGLTTQLDVDQARRSLESTRSTIPSLQTNLDQAKYRLAVLLGKPPGALSELLAEQKPVPVTPLEIAVGVPANLLRRRPDVRSAERKLAAQTAQIGVAEAARFPTFSLLGSIGLESLKFANLYTGSAVAAQAGANAAWTLFNGGGIRENIKAQTALQEQALSKYESTILTALKDVENSLVAYVNEQERRRHLQEAVQAGQSAFDLARTQYEAGLVDFNTVLDTQRSLLVVQEQLAISDADITSNLIRLYKALGGGWTPGTKS